MNAVPLASRALHRTIAKGLMIVVAFTSLAHGAVEPWSLFIFECMLLALVALWAVKAVKEKQPHLAIPDLTLPLASKKKQL